MPCKHGCEVCEPCAYERGYKAGLREAAEYFEIIAYPHGEVGSLSPHEAAAICRALADEPDAGGEG